MSIESNLEYLATGGFRSGRVVAESGEIINLATLLDNASDLSGALINISLEHSKIHQGIGWEVSIETGNIASGTNYYILFRTAAGYRPHLRSYDFIATDAPITIRLFESPTTSTNGDNVIARNRNRNYTDTNGVTVYTQPTVTNDGTLLETDYLASAGNKIGGNAGSFYEEWVLKPSTDYVVKITNGSNNTVTGFFNAFWYT